MSELIDLTEKCIALSFSQNIRKIGKRHMIQKQPPEVFCKKGVLRNFAKFRTPVPVSISSLYAQVFSCEFREISKYTIFTEQLWATASNNRNIDSSKSKVKRD